MIIKKILDVCCFFFFFVLFPLKQHQWIDTFFIHKFIRVALDDHEK